MINYGGFCDITSEACCKIQLNLHSLREAVYDFSGWIIILSNKVYFQSADLNKTNVIY